MSYRRLRARAGQAGFRVRACEGRRWGRGARQLSPQVWFGLEERTLLTNLGDVLNAYDGGVQAIAGDAQSITAAIDGPQGPFAATPSLVGDNLGALLGIGDLFEHPFQAPLAFESGATSSVSWSQVVSDFQENHFTVLYPSATASTFAGTPDANGNLLVVSWQDAPSVPIKGFQVSGITKTGFDYLDNGLQGAGMLTGTLNAPAPGIQAQVVMGVDLQGGNPAFFVESSGGSNNYGPGGTSASTSISVGSFDATESLATPPGAYLQIGDLQNVTMSQTTASVTLQAAMTFLASAAETDGKLRAGDFTASPAPPVQGTMNGSVQIGASFSAQAPPLPSLDWTGSFQGTIADNAWQPAAADLPVTDTYVQNTLSSIASSVLSTTGNFSFLGDLTSFLTKPLPLLNQSIAQITGLNNALPTIPILSALAGPLDSITAIESDLYQLGFKINGESSPPSTGDLETMIGNLIQGKYVNIIQWDVSGSTTLLNKSKTVPITDLVIPPAFNLAIEAKFGLSATLNYEFGIGFDTRGLWLQQGSGVSLDFKATAGLEGSLTLLGFLDLAKVGGDIGFEVKPYVSIAADPYTAAAHLLDSAIPTDHVYLSDLRAFGSNPFEDFIDSLTEGISGDFTGDVYAKIVIGVSLPFVGDVSITLVDLQWGITIPIFNYAHNPAWPLGSSSPGSGGSISQNGGTLTIDGSPGADFIRLNGGNGSVLVNWAGRPAQSYQNVTKVIFTSNGGADQLTAAPGFNIPISASAAGDSSPVYFQGGSGGNTLIGGTAHDTLIGGDGADSITAGSGGDLIFSGDGNDTIVGGTGGDTIYTGSGNDLITAGSGVYQIADGSGADTIHGGAGGTGTGTEQVYQQQADGSWAFVSVPGVTTYPMIYAGGGNDLVYGPASGGTIDDEAGNNTVYAGAGNTTIIGGTGDDTIHGGNGNDLIYASLGNSLIYGGGGNNTIHGGAGDDTIFGGDGLDLLGPGSGDGLSSGSNMIVAGAGNDTIYGDSTGHNTLMGTTGSDTLYAGSGGDVLDPGTGPSALYGGPGNDTLVLHFIPAGTTQPPDTLSGGPGTDSILIDGSDIQLGDGTYAGDTIALNPATGAAPGSYTATQQSQDTSGNPTSGSVTFTMPADVEGLAIKGGDGNNLIQVNSAIYQNITLDGGAGNDTLIAGSGNDVLIGGGGSNLLMGGAGDDILYGDEPPRVAADALNSPGGGLTPNTNAGTVGNDTLIGGAGDNQLYAGNGNDVLIGGDAVQQNGQWVLENTVGSNRFFAGSGNDLMIAGPGTLDSQMEGGTGDDTMVGGNGLNVMDGGGGNALMLGGNLGNTMYADFAIDSQNPTAVPVSINAATWASGVATITTSAIPAGSAGFSVGQSVTISGMQPAGYDGTFTITSVVSTSQSTTFTYALATGPGTATALGSVAPTAGNVTMVGGSGVDYLTADGSGNDVLIGDGDTSQTTPLVAGYWAEAQASALKYGVILQPPTSLIGSNPIQEYEELQNQDDELAKQIEPILQARSDLQAIQNQTTQVTNELQVLQAELTPLLNAENLVLEERIEVNNILGATNMPDILVAGTGNDTLMGGMETAKLEGGTGNDVLYYGPNPKNTYSGSIGGHNTILFVDTNPGDTISLNDPDPANANAIQVAMGTGLSQTTYDWIPQSGIQILGVDALGSGETVDVNFGQAAPMQVSVQLGPGNDTIDASTFQGQETLLGGTGKDTIMVSSQLTNGDVFDGGTGRSTLDVVFPGDPADANQTNVATVKGGALAIGNVLLEDQGGSITAGNSTSPRQLTNFQTIEVTGGSGTNTLYTDGSFPDVIFQGGSGSNTLTADLPSPATAELIGGSGPNELTASGGTVVLRGGSGANTFNLNGPGHYTIDGEPVAGSATPTSSGPAPPLGPNGVSHTSATVNDLGLRYGYTTAAVGQYVICAGGYTSGVYSNITDVYDTITGQWTDTVIPDAFYNATEATVGNYAIFAGGANAEGTYSNTVDIFDASSGNWVTNNPGLLQPLSQPRAQISAITVGNYAIFAGGNSASGYSNAVDIFDAETKTWLTPTHLSQGREFIDAAAVGNYAIFAGGQNGGLSNVVDIFDTKTGTWLSPQTLSQPRDGMSALTVGDRVIFAGGYGNSGPISAVDIYDASTENWISNAPQLSQGQAIMAAATVGEYAIFAGGIGADGNPTATVNIYDASTGHWLPNLPQLSVARDNIAMARVGDFVVFAGGNDTTGGYVSAVDILNGDTGTLLPGPPQLSADRNTIGVTVGSEAVFAGGYVGPTQTTASVDIFTLPPIVTTIGISNTSGGKANVNYTLTGENGSSNPASIQLQYSVDGGPWQTGHFAAGSDGTISSDGLTISDLTSSPTGTSHTLLWDTARDLGDTNNPSVLVRITPWDSIGTGDTVTSPPFAVDNTSIVNNLVINGNDSTNDSIEVTQNGSIVGVSVKPSGASSATLTISASNMTSITVIGGTGSNTLDASETSMPITLDGGTGIGADTLIGGSGSDSFVYSGSGSKYQGGTNGDNTLVYPANSGDVISELLPELIVNGAARNLGGISGIENLLVTGSPDSVNDTQQTLWPVYEATLSDATISSISAVPNSPLTDLVASFTDTSPGASATTDTALIHWGDGTTSAGTVTAASGGAGSFDVAGSHIYQTNGSWFVYVTIVDSAGSATTTGVASYSGGLELTSGTLTNVAGSSSSDVDTHVASFRVEDGGPTPIVFALHDDGSLWAIAGSNRPSQVDNGVQTILLGPDGTLYDLHGNGGSLYSIAPGSSSGLNLVAGSVQSVVEDANGNVYRLDSDATLSVLISGASANSGWSPVQGSNENGTGAAVRSIALDPSGTSIDVMYTDGNGYRLAGTAWTFIEGPQFHLTAPASVAAGQSFNFTLEVVDALGEPVPDYTGTVQFSGAAGSLGDYSFTTADAGSHTFSLTLDAAIAQVIAVDDPNTGISTATSVTITPGSVPAVLRVVMIPQPLGGSGTLQEGTQVNAPTEYMVFALDQYGNIVTGDNDQVTLTSSDPKAVFSPTTVQLSQGEATVNVTFFQSGGQTLTATDADPISGTSDPVQVSPGTATQFVISAPSSLLSGQQFSLTITAEDANGNVATGYTGTVAFTDYTAFSGISPTYTFTSQDAGVHTFPGLVANTPGAQTLGVTDSQDGNLSNSVTIAVSEQKPTSFSAVSGSAIYGGTATLTATLTQGGAPLAGKSVGFTLSVGGTSRSAGAATTDANGVATVSGVSLPGIDAGLLSGAITVNFGGDLTDAPAAAGGDLTISPAPATLSLGGLSFTYDGSATSATVTTSPAGLSGVAIAYSQDGASVAAPTAAGTYEVTATLANSDYAAPAVSGTLTISQGTPSITWSSPADISYGTALGSAQLDARSSVSGTFLYTPAAGTLLNAGASQTLSVLFTPDDAVDERAVAFTTTINVQKAAPTIQWANPADIVYGTAIGSAQLDATANVPGTFAYSIAPGTILDAGAGQVLTATFTPQDSVDASAVTVTTKINVDPAPLTITADDASKTAGQPNPALSVAYAGFVLGQGPGILNGTLTLSTGATAASPAGTYAVIPGGLTSTNYAITYRPGTLTVTPAPSPSPSPSPTPSPTVSPTTPPVAVESIRWESMKLTRKKTVKELVLTFSGPLDAGSADNPSAYTLDAGKKVKKRGMVFSRPIRLLSPSYSPGTDAVTLILGGKAPAKVLQLTIHSALIQDASGRSIQGNGGGTGSTGGDFVAKLSSTGVISMARPLAESRSARIAAAAIDALTADGSVASMIQSGGRTGTGMR